MDIILRIAFDPTNNWNDQAFRDMIQNMLVDNTASTNQIEVYLITTNTDTEYVNTVATEAGLDSNYVIQCANNQAVITTLQQYNINIYLSQDQTLNDLINTSNGISLVQNDVTGCQAISTVSIIDRYYLQMLYITHLQFWIKQIEKYS